MSSRKKLLNPFRPTRWEYENQGENLIWFTRNSSKLLGDKPTYVYGNRGSGKTTLLKSICWEDSTSNSSLMMQRKLQDSDYIGIYVRLPDHVRSSMGQADWSIIAPDSPDNAFDQHVFFSLAIEAICSNKVMEAVNTLRRMNYISLSAESEIKFVGAVIDEFPKLLEFCDRPPHTLSEFSICFKNLVRRMNQSSGRGELQRLLPKLPEREPNELIDFVCKYISEVIKYPEQPQTKLRFKFCIDDCEVMGPLQLKSVNTLLRKSSSPVSWVLCSVGELPDISTTFIPEQPITGDDRLVIPLNIDSTSEFLELCQAVASLRLYFALPEKARPKLDGSKLHAYFDLRRRLGTNDTNVMFEHIIKSSKNSIASVLLRSAEVLRDKTGSRELSYYKSYVLAHWNGGKMIGNSPRESFDANVDVSDFVQRVVRHTGDVTNLPDDGWMRRKRVAAILHFSSKLGIKRIPYYGHDLVTHLADRSIRDFLEIMSCIFDEFLTKRATNRGNLNPADMELSTLVTANQRFAVDGDSISNQIQTIGIYSASEASFAQLKSQIDDQPEMMTSLVDALGRYTELLQANHEDAATLATAERGVFVVNRSSGDDEFMDLVETLVRRAVLAGYLTYVPLRQNKDSKSSLQRRFQGFRLRKRLAPKFGFSYRGAYEVVQLNEDFFLAALRPTNQENLQTWLSASRSRASRQTVDASQLELSLEVIAGRTEDKQ
jgi:hypothetical protein